MFKNYFCLAFFLSHFFTCYAETPKEFDIIFKYAKECYSFSKTGENTAEMLFIPSEDNQTAIKLNKSSSFIKKYICICGTNLPEAWQEVTAFLNNHPEWSLERRSLCHCGLTILKRNTHLNEVDFILQNKIILCIGPSLNRKEMLKQRTEDDMAFIPFKKIFLHTNDENNLDITFKGQKPVCRFFPPKGHHIDCLNCVITSIQDAVSDPSTCEDDIILFKHESLYINDIYLVRRSIEKLIEGYDIIARNALHVDYCDTAGFFIKVSAAKQIFPHLTTLDALGGEYPRSEDFYTKAIVKATKKPYIIHHSHSHRGITEFGFDHILPPWTGPDIYWDKQNYYELFE